MFFSAFIITIVFLFQNYFKKKQKNGIFKHQQSQFSRWTECAQRSKNCFGKFYRVQIGKKIITNSKKQKQCLTLNQQISQVEQTYTMQ